MSEIDDEVYPKQIRGHLEIKRTGDRVVLVAKRGEMRDGYVQYQTTTEVGGPLPATSDDFIHGRVAVEFDMVPGMSAMNFAFEKRITEA